MDNMPIIREKDVETLDNTIKTYGSDFQISKCIEELEELQAVLKNNGNNKEGNNEEVIDEIADSLITILTVSRIKNISTEEVLNRISYKVDRARRRMSRTEWEIKNQNKLKEMCKLNNLEDINCYIFNNFNYVTDEFNTNIINFIISLCKNIDLFYIESDKNYLIKKLKTINNSFKMINFKYNGNDITSYLKFYNM